MDIGYVGGLPGKGSCSHVVDPDAFPGWDPRVGKVFVCKLCGEKVYDLRQHVPPMGKRVRMSKKERRRQKALQGGEK
jgi:hypothetical protein